MNADDAGIHPAVRRGIELLRDKKLLTGISVVATGMDLENAARVPDVDVGIHLDILRGRPVSHWQHIVTLVDENGAFLENPVTLFQRYAKGKVDHEHVEMEWAAQIERVLDLGVRPSHITSHKHVHGWPSLSRMVADLAKKYGIHWIRKPEECAEISRMKKDGVDEKFRNVCSMFERESTDVNWTDVFWPGDGSDGFSVDSFVSHFRESVSLADGEIVEICCRPGVTKAGDPPIPQFCNPTQIGAVWEKEYTSLANEDWKGALENEGLTLSRISGLDSSE